MKQFTSVMILSLSLVALATHAQTIETSAHLKEPNKININKASVEELAHAFKGIGNKRAQSIIDYREQHGSFKSLNELASVHGLGERFVKLHLSELQTTFVY